MFKLDLENAEEAETKLIISTGSQKNAREFQNTSASLSTLKPLTMWITTNHGIFFKRWECQSTLPAS